MEKWLRLILSCLLSTAVTSLIITQDPSNTSTVAGEDIILTCETSEEGELDLLEWLEYVTRPEGERVWISSEDPGNIEHPDGGEKFEIIGTYNLKIKDIALNYGGKYGCKLVVQDRNPRIAYVSVFEPAQCANMGEDLHEYDMAYISCYVSYGSELPPDVYFYDNGKKMAIDYERGNNYIYISSNITAMAEDDANPFECRVTLSDPLYEDSCTTSLSIKYTARNVTFEPHYETYYSGDRIECKAKGNPTPTIRWEEVESPGGEENIEGAFLVVTESMTGSNRWACNAENTVQGNTTYLREEIIFQVVPGSTPEDAIESASSQSLSLVLLLLAALSMFLSRSLWF